ncbi:Detected protein of unknown function [Hibiscus syriacus]|uniref:Uncharacterized protein n=1 Tax=Hibiscus syriacus TaxID=106335 RepID=A0A6A3BH72_HIBSY|nr:uncharacterized protein LOC120218414 [Hibiscus syriacus]KAE8714362.1 Detected protein of unknown function [Hibiscus syriacus]
MRAMSSISASICLCKVGMDSSGKLQTAIIGFGHSLVIAKHKAKYHIPRNPNLQSLGTALRLQHADRDNNMVVCCSVGSGPSFPSNPGPSSWKLWVMGILMSMVLPFWRSKWGPLLKLKDEVETVIDKVEAATDIVEKVAEQVEGVADDIGNHLPEGRLKDALEIVEDIAKNTADGARLAGEFIDKVEEVEEKVESWMEQNNTVKEAKKTKGKEAGT